MFNYIDLTLQMTLAIFFVAAGYRKVFDPITRESVWGVFKKYNVPTWQGHLVTWGQLAGGLGLGFGVLSWWAALGLMPIMLGAWHLSKFPELKAEKPRGVLGWMIKGVCKESLIIAMLVALLVRGF